MSSLHACTAAGNRRNQEKMIPLMTLPATLKEIRSQVQPTVPQIDVEASETGIVSFFTDVMDPTLA